MIQLLFLATSTMCMSRTTEEAAVLGIFGESQVHNRNDEIECTCHNSSIPEKCHLPSACSNGYTIKFHYCSASSDTTVVELVVALAK